MTMRTYRCAVCQAPVYYAVRDESAEEVLRVDVEPNLDGTIALASRYVGLGNGTFFEDDHLVIYREIPPKEVYKGPRRTPHRCPAKRQSPESCRSCKAPIYWAATSNGKSMPVDAAPVEDGNVLLEFSASGIKGRVLSAKETHEGERYVSHFVTCPNSNNHRRKK